MKNSVYKIITEKIVSLLESGVVPWRKPWSGQSMAPQNLVSRQAYRGINAFLLACMPYDSPFWVTYKQAAKLGGTVKKGEKAMPVVYWNWVDRTGTEKDDPTKVPLLRYYRVFHVSQCELPENAIPDVEVDTCDFEPIRSCELLLEQVPENPKVCHGGARACYFPAKDQIHMPKPEKFDMASSYYATLFHELGHWTGHESRLNRPDLMDQCKFASHAYSREELVAEFVSAYLCGHCGIESDTIENAAAYIGNWLTRLKNDSKLVVIAAAKAQKAADYLLSQAADGE